MTEVSRPPLPNTPIPTSTPKPASASAPNGDSPYRRDIDGLRAIAVLSVVLFHAFPEGLRGGFVGVDIFFVISGFLISGKIFEDLDADGFSYTAFYGRRIRRLFPALLLVLGSCLAIGWFVLLPNEYELLGKHTTAGLAFLANLALWKEAASYFNAEVDTRPLLHLWSLGIEEQFYIVWPPLLFLIWKIKKFFMPLVLGLSLLSLLAGLYYLQQRNVVSAFYLPWARFWELFAGGVLAYLLRYRPGVLAALPASRQGLGVLLIVPAVVLMSESLPFPGWLALIPVSGAFLVLAGQGRAPSGLVENAGLASRLLTSRVMVWFGLISYPLYLWHWPVLSFTRIVAGETPDAVLRVAAVGLSVLLAWATYCWVELPLRFHRRKRAVTVALCGVAVVFAGYGAVLWKTDVISGRAMALKYPDFSKAFNQTRYSDGSCERLLGKTPLAEETCLVNAKEPEFLVIGDSHGMALNSAAHLGLVPMKTMIVSAHSCMLYPNLTHVPLFDANYGRNCKAIAADAIQTALTLPSIKTIIIAHSAAVFSADEGTVSFDYRDASGQSISQYQAFMQGNYALIQQLIPSGKKIVLFKDTHHLLKNPLDCVSRFGTSDRSACQVPLSDVARRRARYDGATSALMQTLRGVELYEPLRSLCDNEACYGNDGNLFYFFDKHHLSAHGSQKVLADYLKTARIVP